MAFVLKDIFFGLFGPYENKVDINKDAFNKGTLERYHEALADEYDDNLHSLIEELVDNNLVWSTALEKMIPYLEIRLGIELFMGSAMSWRRLVIHHVIRWYAIKGTIRAYTIMLKMLGFTGVTITEDFQQYGLDSPVTFDDDRRRFDSGCNLCGSYTIALTGSLTLTPEIERAIFSVIEFNEPIHAFLEVITYNGVDIPIP